MIFNKINSLLFIFKLLFIIYSFFIFCFLFYLRKLAFLIFYYFYKFNYYLIEFGIFHFSINYNKYIIYLNIFNDYSSIYDQNGIYILFMYYNYNIIYRNKNIFKISFLKNLIY